MTMTTEQIQAALDKGGTVVLPAGTYRVGTLRVPKGATLAGAGARLEGSKAVPATAWTSVSGTSLKSAPYTAMPVKDGLGIAFSSGQNLTVPAGRFADQAWTLAAGDTRLKRVMAKSSVVRGTFAVESGRMFVHKDDAAAGVLVSDRRVALVVEGTVRDVTVSRFSPTPADGAAVQLKGGTLDGVSVDSCSFVSVNATGANCQLRHVRITRAGWMGVSALLATNLVLDTVVWEKVNSFGFYASAPQSGALKTSRCRGVTVLGPQISATNSHGLWFDQSTSDVVVDGGSIDVTRRGVFFEISYGLALTGARIRSQEEDAVRVAGAGGVCITGCDLQGKTYDVGVFVDKRSIAGYADPSVAMTEAMREAGVYTSDRRSVEWRDTRITWMPKVYTLQANVLHPPTGGGPAVYASERNGDAYVPKSKIFPYGYQS